MGYPQPKLLSKEDKGRVQRLWGYAQYGQVVRGV